MEYTHFSASFTCFFFISRAVLQLASHLEDFLVFSINVLAITNTLSWPWTKARCTFLDFNTRPLLDLCFYLVLYFWLILTAAHSDMNVVTILVGNKTDLKHAREVSTAEGQALAEAQGLFFMETSALDSSNVAAAFQTVVKEIYSILSRKVFQSQEQKRSELQSLSNGKAVVLQGEANETSNGGRWCCSS